MKLSKNKSKISSRTINNYERTRALTGMAHDEFIDFMIEAAEEKIKKSKPLILSPAKLGKAFPVMQASLGEYQCSVCGADYYFSAEGTYVFCLNCQG